MLGILFYSFLTTLFCMVLVLGFFAVYIMSTLPDLEELHRIRIQVPLRIYSADGSLIAEYGEKRKRKPLDIEEVPDLFIKAFIASEDDRFYAHPGVDWQGLARAVRLLVRDGKASQGGSTITMQLARDLFLSRERTYTRKLREIVLALQIESVLEKDQILELYMNKVLFGNRAYGIEAAAQIYYGRSVQELELAQIATLVGLVPRPSEYNPVRDPAAAKKKRNYVLRRMLEKNFITQAQHDFAKARPVTASLHGTASDVEAPYVAEMVRLELQRRFGDSIYSDGLVVKTTIRDKHQIAANSAVRATLLDYDRRHGYRGAEYHVPLADPLPDEQALARLLRDWRSVGGLIPALVTQVQDTSVQAFLVGIGPIDISWENLKWARRRISQNRLAPPPVRADQIVRPGDIIRVFENSDGDWQLSQVPDAQGALVSLDPQSGALLSLVGGFDFSHSSYNRATQAKRQPGSSFKPILYSAALEAGETAATLINDAPVVYANRQQPAWRPENYTGKSYGPTRLREALIHSRNLVSVRLLEKIGVPRLLEHAEKFGLDTERMPRGLSLSLGAAELTVWELTRAYSVFANGGHLIDPWFIESVHNQDGELLYEATPKQVCADCPVPADTEPGSFEAEAEAEAETEAGAEVPAYAPQVIDPRIAYIISSITQDVIQHGTGRKARILERNDIGGKTGTTNNQQDSWFSGYNQSLVAVCWVGFDQLKGLGRRETGSRIALPMWIDYMKVALEDIPETDMPRPEGIIDVRIDKERSLFETFRVEYAPQADTNTDPGGEDPALLPEQLF